MYRTEKKSFVLVTPRWLKCYRRHIQAQGAKQEFIFLFKCCFGATNTICHSYSRLYLHFVSLVWEECTGNVKPVLRCYPRWVRCRQQAGEVRSHFLLVFDLWNCTGTSARQIHWHRCREQAGQLPVCRRVGVRYLLIRNAVKKGLWSGIATPGQGVPVRHPNIKKNTKTSSSVPGVLVKDCNNNISPPGGTVCSATRDEWNKG